MSEPLDTLGSLRAALDSGAVSSADLVERCVTRARASQEALHAFAGLRAEGARADAAAADARRARGEVRSPLDGLPVAIKDNMVQAGEPTTCASRILEGFVSPYTATAVARLEQAGAIAIGRTNMDEFAMGSSTEHSVYGPARNPWDRERTPGGSSGGSAAAVAAGDSCPAPSAATPAARSGSRRRCPGWSGSSPPTGGSRAGGWWPLPPPSTRSGCWRIPRPTVPGCWRRSPATIRGIPPRFRSRCPRYSEALGGDVSGLVLGLPREYFVEEGVDPEVLSAVRSAVSELERAGAKIREVSLPHTRYAVATYYLIATAEASSNLARYDGVRYGHRTAAFENLADMYQRTRSEGFGDEVKRRIILGTYVLSAGYYDAYYRKAQQVRTLLRRDFEQAFRGCDAIATPTCPETAFRIASKTDDPLTMYLSDIYTVSANLAGIPGVSIPCGFAKRLPVGLQLLGRVLDEATLLRIADAFQRRTDHHRQRPPEAP